jgi:poly-gamma-glutamate synthesis protein (capsule biosynthesis protein)
MADSVKLAFLGDVMLGRGVNQEIPSHPPEFFWGDVLPVLRGAGAAIANLECALTGHLVPWRKTPKVFHFRADPAAVKVLQAGNIRCVSLANNHSLDFEERGLFETLEVLDKAEILHAGAGRDLSEARKPALLSVEGFPVAFIAMTDNEPPFAAGLDRPGTNFIELDGDAVALGLVEEAVSRAKRMGAEFIVLSLHWGPNMVLTPPTRFKKFARDALERGVDLIHGHSAHLFQGVERHGKGLILYDTGDFLDDYSVDPQLRNDRSFIFLVEAGGKGVKSLKLVPVRLRYAQVNRAQGEDFEAICTRMRQLSAPFGLSFESVPDGLLAFFEE